MNSIVMSIALVMLLGGCAGPVPPGVQQTQAMTDMDGKPIDPGPTGISSGGFGMGIWGGRGRGGGGLGVGIGW
jgi:hypothetical protein